MAEYPSYDPNNPTTEDGQYLGNRSISNVFEPGSTGKLFTLATALEEGTATPGVGVRDPVRDVLRRVSGSRTPTTTRIRS